jgi:transitional endoplasmic reticulum ATPase
MSAVRRLVASGKEPTEEEIANCKVSMDDMLKAVDKFGPAATAKIKEYGENSIYRH